MKHYEVGSVQFDGKTYFLYQESRGYEYLCNPDQIFKA